MNTYMSTRYVRFEFLARILIKTTSHRPFLLASAISEFALEADLLTCSAILPIEIHATVRWAGSSL